MDDVIIASAFQVVGITSGWFADAVANGNIRIQYETEVDNGKYTYDFQNATLFTSSKSGNAADMFNRVMNEQGKNVYDLGVPIIVELETEGIAGGRAYYDYMIRSRTDYDRPDRGFAPADRAWSNLTWETIDEVKKVTGEHD